MLIGKSIGNIKKEGASSLRISDELGAGPLSTTTIQDMLKGVNGSQGKLYFQGKDAEVVRGMTSMMGDDKKIIEHFDQANFFTFAL